MRRWRVLLQWGRGLLRGSMCVDVPAATEARALRWARRLVPYSWDWYSAEIIANIGTVDTSNRAKGPKDGV